MTPFPLQERASPNAQSGPATTAKMWSAPQLIGPSLVYDVGRLILFRILLDLT